MKELLTSIRACTICSEKLAHTPRPVLQASPSSVIAIVGQAPGKKVHQSGIPYDDASGKRLRNWLGVDESTFYNDDIFDLVPMGFCYPGTGKSGDLPPRKECAPTWHQQVWDKMPNIQLILLIGQYAQRYYLPNNPYPNLTETILHYETHIDKFWVLPHPSPRNEIWLKKNEWFEQQVIPKLKNRVATCHAKKNH